MVMEMDAVVLAGGKEGAKLIRGKNKAFLPLRGRLFLFLAGAEFAAPSVLPGETLSGRWRA